MADNYREETTTRKRGRSPSKLSVKLFLLDPNKNITKVTKEIGSEKGLNELKQKGYGPPSKGKYNWLINKISTISRGRNFYRLEGSERVYWTCKKSLHTLPGLTLHTVLSFLRSLSISFLCISSSFSPVSSFSAFHQIVGLLSWGRLYIKGI